MSNKYATIKNCGIIPVKNIPVLQINDFRDWIIQSVKDKKRISSFFGVKTDKNNIIKLYGVISDDISNCLHISSCYVENYKYESITKDCPQAHIFEREIAEQFGIIPEGHPWLKPVRYIHSWTEKDAWNRNKQDKILPACGDFYRVEGEEIHEVAVGPVHAGIIEPGHFRFQCNGEEVFHLEIALGYQHRGIEESLINGPDKKTLHYIENIAGDTAIGHTTCYSQIIEALSGTKVSAKSQVIRAIALELERLANHVGDLGSLANDVGYLPTSSFCGRIRGDYLNLTALLCGNRFGRGMVRPGGIGFDIDNNTIGELKKRLTTLENETYDAINLLWENQSVLARFENTGKISKEIATDLGLVGVAARACGIDIDIRYNMPTGIYCFSQISVSTYDSCDVFARGYVRWLEIQRSIDFIKDQIKSLPQGVYYKQIDKLQPDSLVVSLNEGWRGEICHTAITDSNGRFVRYKIVDPSFHNWTGLAMALRNEAISDFPLCNKSFNLSYCGFDL